MKLGKYVLLYGTIIAAEGLAKWSQKERGYLVLICKRRNIDPDALATIIGAESAGDPTNDKAISAQTGLPIAGGLIQFHYDTAHKLGYTIEELVKLPIMAQLDLIDKQYAKQLGQFKPRYWTLYDLYITNFMGGPKTGRICEKGSSVCNSNPAIDRDGGNNDGNIDRGEVDAYIKKYYDKYAARVRLPYFYFGKE